MSARYIDGISQVHFMNGMIKMDLFTLQPQANADPLQEKAGQLVMTPQGFLNALGAMQQLADKLVEAGVIQKTQQQ